MSWRSTLTALPGLSSVVPALPALRLPFPVTLQLRDRVVFVTGATRGLGAQVARDAHARGARVALVGRRRGPLDELVAELGDRVAAFEADVTDLAALERAVADAVERFGGIDVVVANAGVAPSPHSILSIDPDEFERVVDVDLLGQWRTLRATLPALIERRGHVVVIASIYSFVNGVLNAPYAASKAGVEQLVRALRVEAAPYGVTAGAAYLGFVDTELADEAFATDHVAQARGALPDFVTRAIPVADASAAVLDGVERRRASITAPAWVLPALVARSLVTAVDEYLMRSRAVLDAIVSSDREVGALRAREH